MRSSVPGTVVRMTAKTLHSSSHEPRRLTKADRSVVSDLVRAVMARVGLSQKAMAQNAAIGESVLSEALAPHGTRHLAMEWLLAQDDEFLLELLAEITTWRGLTVESRRDVKAARIAELVRLIVECA